MSDVSEIIARVMVELLEEGGTMEPITLELTPHVPMEFTIEGVGTFVAVMVPAAYDKQHVTISLKSEPEIDDNGAEEAAHA